LTTGLGAAALSLALAAYAGAVASSQLAQLWSSDATRTQAVDALVEGAAHAALVVKARVAEQLAPAEIRVDTEVAPVASAAGGTSVGLVGFDLEGSASGDGTWMLPIPLTEEDWIVGAEIENGTRWKRARGTEAWAPIVYAAGNHEYSATLGRLPMIRRERVVNLNSGTSQGCLVLAGWDEAAGERAEYSPVDTQAKPMNPTSPPKEAFVDGFGRSFHVMCGLKAGDGIVTIRDRSESRLMAVPTFVLEGEATVIDLGKQSADQSVSIHGRVLSGDSPAGAKPEGISGAGLRIAGTDVRAQSSENGSFQFSEVRQTAGLEVYVDIMAESHMLHRYKWRSTAEPGEQTGSAIAGQDLYLFGAERVEKWASQLAGKIGHDSAIWLKSVHSTGARPAKTMGVEAEPVVGWDLLARSLFERGQLVPETYGLSRNDDLSAEARVGFSGGNVIATQLPEGIQLFERTELGSGNAGGAKRTVEFFFASPRAVLVSL